MCDAPISSHWGSQNSPAPAHSDSPVQDPQSYIPVPIMQLPARGRSGNPFASVHASTDDAQLAADSTAAAAQPAAGAVVPRLALHRLPAPFGNAGGHSSQVGQSRLGLESAMVVPSSFTSASLSYSEMTSTGYTTRSPSPDAGLKSHFLHAAMSQREEYGDATLAVSNPLFGCSPKRGNSPGEPSLVMLGTVVLSLHDSHNIHICVVTAPAGLCISELVKIKVLVFIPWCVLPIAVTNVSLMSGL